MKWYYKIILNRFGQRLSTNDHDNIKYNSAALNIEKNNSEYTSQ